ncbi:MAG: UDP-2,3-diacylglucosamine diphosphatase LpxI [Candidatus Omnitrophota bacterium]
MKDIKRLAIIAGNGKFPIILAKTAISSGIETVVIAIKSEADCVIEDFVDNVFWIELGEAKKLINILQNEKIEYAIMAGKVTKTTLFKNSLKLDKEARTVLSRVMDKKDDTLLAAVASRLKDFNVELLDSTTFMKNLMPEKGVLTSRKPNSRQKEDIAFGFKIAKELGRLDIGQSVVVKDKAVMSLEAIEGTDLAIKRGGKLGGEGVVVVKVAKPNQDMRFDVPVIGLETIESLKAVKASALAIEAGKVLVFEKEEVIRLANDNNIVIVAVD